MSVSKQIKNTAIRLEKGDITDFEVEAFVFYAEEDLKLGAGFGNAIAMRGGPTIQKALDQLAPAKLGDAIITEAGNMKAQYIVHAVGPKFQEEDIENKLVLTVRNTLKAASEKGIKQLALPAMGSGFYGIPADVCADLMIDSIQEYLNGGSEFNEIIIRVIDTREYEPFKKKMETLN